MIVQFVDNGQVSQYFIDWNTAIVRFDEDDYCKVEMFFRDPQRQQDIHIKLNLGEAVKVHVGAMGETRRWRL